jgi:hypothetical protein
MPLADNLKRFCLLGADPGGGSKWEAGLSYYPDKERLL